MKAVVSPEFLEMLKDNLVIHLSFAAAVHSCNCLK